MSEGVNQWCTGGALLHNKWQKMTIEHDKVEIKLNSRNLHMTIDGDFDNNQPTTPKKILAI